MTFVNKILQLFNRYQLQGPPEMIEELESLILNNRQLEYLQVAVNKAALLENHFGADFVSFFNRPGIDKVITVELPDILEEGTGTFLDNNHWDQKHPYNFPGPFYTGDTDTCATGPLMAPFNVLLDDEGTEFVAMQPKNYIELFCLKEAAAMEVYNGYSCNGNAWWTYRDCQYWWRHRGEVVDGLYRKRAEEFNGAPTRIRYINYLEHQAAEDLKKYCYFLEHGKYPAPNILRLPDL